MMQASRVTLPSRSGRPPLPTVSLVISASSTITPCSTASRAEPPACNTSQALALAFMKFQVHTTRGLIVVLGARDALGSPLQETRGEAVTSPAAGNPEFLRK